MKDFAPILQLPIEVLQKIARLDEYSIPVRFQPNKNLTPLLHFRLVCKVFEKASFDVLVERFPSKLRCYVNDPTSLKNFLAQTSQPRLRSRLKQVTLEIDILAGSNIGDIQTAENFGQELENVQCLDYKRLESDFYNDPPSFSKSDLAISLKHLQTLPTPPAIRVSVWLSEDIYLENNESKNTVPMLSHLMLAIPPTILHTLSFAYLHCDPSPLLHLLRNSHTTLQEFSVDNVSLASSTPQWIDILQELTHCTKLSKVMLCNLREECLDAVLSTRERSAFSPRAGYLLAGFTGREGVVEGLRELIGAELCVADSAWGVDGIPI